MTYAEFLQQEDEIRDLRRKYAARWIRRRKILKVAIILAWLAAAAVPLLVVFG